MDSIHQASKVCEEASAILKTEGPLTDTLQDIDECGVSLECRLLGYNGALIMTDLEVTEVRAAIVTGTTFVPPIHRGKGYGKAMLMALGGFHNKFLMHS